MLRITRPGPEVVALEGELDIVGADELRVGLPLDDLPGDELHLDLSGLEFLDSMGLSALIDVARELDRRGARLRTTSPPGSEARLVIDMSGLAPQLGLEPVV